MQALRRSASLKDWHIRQPHWERCPPEKQGLIGAEGGGDATQGKIAHQQGGQPQGAQDVTLPPAGGGEHGAA